MSDPTTNPVATWTRPPRRWRRRRYVLLAIGLLLILAAVIADRVQLNYYVLTPGKAQPVGPLVRVPAADAHRLHGKVLLTDVYLTRVSALSYLVYHFDGDAQLVPAATVLGPVTAPAELTTQSFLEMAQSQDAAKAAALTRLGYQVGEKNTGAVLFAVAPGSPAATSLKVGQVVTAVDGTAVTDVCSFVVALSAHTPGATVTFSVERSTVNSKATFEPGPTVTEQVRLAPWPPGLAKPTSAGGCGAIPTDQGYLGVEVETQQAFTFPVPVSIRTTAIGGPSAGLAMTLGIIDTLSGGHLTGGRTIAATGTIDPQGAVGAVGGVPQKTVAVERAKATVFFVPAGQRKTAVSKANSSLHVYAVSSLDQVLTILRRLGGTVPTGAAP